ncbi:MAG: hypothetical protein WBX25_29745 [Rhodomicrobium sp.]
MHGKKLNISSCVGKAGEVRPATREQRCWVQKTANVLNKLKIDRDERAETRV